jgi:hypothetical protein
MNTNNQQARPIHHTSPLHLHGNTTQDQRDALKDALTEAVQRIYRGALKELDQHSARLVLEMDEKLKTEIVSAAMKIVNRLTVSDKYKDEEAVSRREYPTNYKVRPIEAQVTELKKYFPKLGSCMEKLGRKPLPDGAEAWFAIPSWQAVAPTYNIAVEMLIDILASKRRFDNRIVGKLGAAYLRQSERTKLAEKILAEQQPGTDIHVVAIQAGLLHRGCSARRSRVVMATNEYGLGAFALGCMLLTHPERLCNADTLMIDCSGDEYSIRGDGVFDRVPLYDYDLSGIEFSIFYEDRARFLWGTPTGFMVQVQQVQEGFGGEMVPKTRYTIETVRI